MNKFTLIIILILSTLSAVSQDKSSEPVKKNRKFYAGFSYSYLNISMKLTALSNYAVWDGIDLGTKVFTDDQIEEINSYVNRINKASNLNVEVGMKLYDKPGSHWQISGKLMGGIAMTELDVYNKNSESSEINLKSRVPLKTKC